MVNLYIYCYLVLTVKGLWPFSFDSQEGGLCVR